MKRYLFKNLIITLRDTTNNSQKLTLTTKHFNGTNEIYTNITINNPILVSFWLLTVPAPSGLQVAVTRNWYLQIHGKILQMAHNGIRKLPSLHLCKNVIKFITNLRNSQHQILAEKRIITKSLISVTYWAVVGYPLRIALFHLFNPYDNVQQQPDKSHNQRIRSNDKKERNGFLCFENNSDEERQACYEKHHLVRHVNLKRSGEFFGVQDKFGGARQVKAGYNLEFKYIILDYDPAKCNMSPIQDAHQRL
ncbi:hypothetical protein NQ317_012800 [Molorchus minor]|uniref:Uncharacterized protein n=1 Tax=Molorchus minor TaxID=1323400 RepID=A0ABQ9K6B1_9CUCU|nr:hypothetical protein NQ317_012800 [Molorchus minor]